MVRGRAEWNLSKAVQVTEMLALVHCQRCHRFYWSGRCGDARECVFLRGCRRRKRTRSQRMAMLPGRYFEPCEILEVVLLRIPNTSGTTPVRAWLC